MRKREDDQYTEDELSIDAETGEELVSADAIEEKLEKLRVKLKAAEKEKTEYLDGWKRAQADLVNFKRRSQETQAAVCTAAKNEVVEKFIPILDTFDAAMQSDSWKSVDETWRKGVEHIFDAFMKALDETGITVVNPLGESFDPTFHDAVQTKPVEKESDDHIILAVLQKGYARGEQLLRPAKVVIGEFQE